MLEPSGSGRAFLAVLTAMATFLAVESLGLFVISRLNDPEDEKYLRVQLADPTFYTIELAVLGSGALATAERIRLRIEALTFTDPRLTVTASVGLAAAPVPAGRRRYGLPRTHGRGRPGALPGQAAGRNRIAGAEPGREAAPLPAH